jgi:hypothetical protein
MNTHNMQELIDAVQNLNGADEQFGASLIRQWAMSGSISQKQMYWVGKLIEKANQPKPPKIGAAGLVRVAQLFGAAARAGLERPKITIAPNIVLSKAGAQSRNPGSIHIKAGRAYDDVFYGRIDADGSLSPSRDMIPDVEQALIAWGEDPAKAAKAYGHEVGACAFCNRRLDDPRSVAAGYGPVCADNYGLPWGDRKVSGEVVLEA